MQSICQSTQPGSPVAQPIRERHGDGLLWGIGLRYNKKAIAAGAQTERRGLAGPVRALLGGWASPAALSLFLEGGIANRPVLDV
jgi:hypothetical protein